MTHRDVATFPLLFLSFSAPNWIQLLQNFWSVALPIGAAVLLILQIIYYYKQIRK
jgi:hypothetical protein